MFLGSEEVGNPYTEASTAAAVGMALMPNVEAIGTLVIAIKREWVFCIQTLALQYGVLCKAYST